MNSAASGGNINYKFNVRLTNNEIFAAKDYTLGTAGSVVIFYSTSISTKVTIPLRQILMITEINWQIVKRLL